jgi:NDP-sugar pyrophosphorylase family protein
VKALVLAAGRGKRLNEITVDANKCMLMLNGRRVITYSLDVAITIGVEEIVLVVGYLAEDIINCFGNVYKNVPIRYAIQHEQRGLVHAMECARRALGRSDFILLLADEILIGDRRKDMVDFFRSRPQSLGVCGLLRRAPEKQKLIHRTYAVIMNEENRIHRLVEKPRTILNSWQGTGNCVLSSRILDYIDYCPIHHERGEKEMPDIIQCAIDDGAPVFGFDVCDDYANLNSQDDIEYISDIIATGQVQS